MSQFPMCHHQHCSSAWHGLPTPDCGGSHLSEDEARTHSLPAQYDFVSLGFLAMREASRSTDFSALPPARGSLDDS
jgi:hypothetical protein